MDGKYVNFAFMSDDIKSNETKLQNTINFYTKIDAYANLCIFQRFKYYSVELVVQYLLIWLFFTLK